MLLLLITYITSLTTSSVSSDNKVKVTNCDVCKYLVETISKGMKDTETKTYEGGTSFAAKKTNVPYQDSELRIITILENICQNSNDKTKCIAFLDKYEQDIEEWFHHLRKKDVDLSYHLCIENSKVCCKPNHYGKNCDLCPGYVNDHMCSNHGTCVGDGTRVGNGVCKCESTYTGLFCDKCSEGSFLDHNGACRACHPSCSGSCFNETAEGCIGACKDGWQKDHNSVCVDIDECSLKLHNCKSDQYCLNEPGRFSCHDCPKYCLTCSSSDPDKCTTCNYGYVKTEDGRCSDIDECLEGKHDCLAMTYCVNNEGSFACKKCNQACVKGCEGPLIEDCFDCKEGYKKNENGTGCIDINECSEKPNICPEGKYCLNKKGSYSCKNCDEACHICFGPGPHSCLSCSQGHTFIKSVCRDTSKIKELETAEDEDDL